MRAVGGATCSGAGRDKRGGGSRCFAGGLLAVRLCPGSAITDRVSQRPFFCWCSSDGVVLGAGVAAFRCGTKLTQFTY